MPWVGFELMIPASERAKKVHTLDRSAAVTGGDWEIWCENYELDMLIYKHNKA
jgi:hypothetical protein